MSSKTPLVSVIIPSYNRFSLLYTAVQSVLNQTYPNIEIIIVNDASTDNDYYSKKLNDTGATIIHLSKNTCELFGYPCAGYVRNIGARIAKGEYLAFLDDDDIWLPHKIEKQIATLTEYTDFATISCTDGYIGYNPWNYLLGSPDTECGSKVYNREHYFDTLCNIYDKAIETTTPKFHLRRDGFPKIWSEDFIKIHNCVITSSVVIKRTIFDKMGGFRELRNGEEDYDLWKRSVSDGYNIVYIDEPHFYYLYRG